MANPNKADSQLADSSGNPLVGEAQDNISDASESHALADSFDDEEAEAALDALGAKINAILDVLEAHGLMKDS